LTVNGVEPEADNIVREMTVHGDNCGETIETLPDKSRSLRRSSVQKRLETEKARSQPRVKEKISKKYRLSKYKRKTENAKERERMKKFNEAFTTLRKILPNSKLSDNNSQSEKDTKVSSLQSAITYINCLQDLLEDCDAGRVGEDIYRRSLLLDVSEKQKKNEIKNKEYNVKQSTEKKKTKNKQLVTDKTGEKKAVHDKWTNYSKIFLEQKFCPNKSEGIGYDIHPNRNQPDQSVHPTMTNTSECSTPPPSSPRDMNMISLHISLLDNYRSTDREADQVSYVYTVTEI
jgi:hypothetical protein